MRLILLWIGSLVAAMGVEPGWEAKVAKAVDEAVKPVMGQYGIPGMAVGVTVEGKRCFVEYGVAAKEPRVAVRRDTLFELGSISKTFTAALAAYAEGEGKLRLEGRVSEYLPELKGSALDGVLVRDLATHTAGGFPLQLPDAVTNVEQLMAYYRAWKPEFARGTQRSYANPSIGLLGIVAARVMGASFESLVEERLFRAMGMRGTYVSVPEQAMGRYAWGYDRENKPIRVAPAMLATEAYGVKSNTVDMIRYVEASMGVGGGVPAKVTRALRATQTGYFEAGEFVQGLIWERYPYPVAVERMLKGNSTKVIFEGIQVKAMEPPVTGGDVLVNKTGSTNGFGAYVVFVPGKKMGMVMLANKNYPIEARVRVAHAVLSRLGQ